jgi:translation initiation factor 2B subunit (eIF-2B alpha/beta/delta family)
LAIDIVEDFISTCAPQEPRDFSADLERLVSDILSAQPSMAVMLNLAQYVLEAVVDEAPFARMKERVQQQLLEFRLSLRQSVEALCRQAIEILPPRATVLTYSNSTTVTAVLRHARAEGHLDRVILSEARPAFDGRPLALSLAEIGVGIDYSTDMGLFAGLQETDLVFLGADAVFPRHFLNKVGTHALAELARVRNVPCFVLCAANKCLPAAATSLLRISTHSGDEVWSTAAPGVRVHNQYFEEVPLPLLNGIVSEQGIRSPDDLQIMLDKRPLPPALLRLANEKI